jgi:hypothetical protein
MRVLLLLGLLAAAATAADALKSYRSDMRRLVGEDKKYWRDFQSRFRDAYQTFRAPLEHSDTNPEATWDFSDLRALYDDYAGICESKGGLDLALAESAHEKALDVLFKELLALGKEVGSLEKEMLDAKPTMGRYICDLRPAIRRHGIAARRDLLVRGLGRCPEASAFLGEEGWKKATKADGKRCMFRRAAVLDALAIAADDLALAALERATREESSSVRIAALENLLRLGARGRPAAARLLDDASPLVRRALLQEVRRRGAKDPGWIEPVLKGFAQSRGLERALRLRALEVLTKQRFGYAPEAWREWFLEYRSEIEGGGFDTEKVEVREVETAPPRQVFSFYGVPSLSHGVAFVIEGSSALSTPARWEVQRSRTNWDWRGTRKSWEEHNASHQTVLRQQFDAAVSGFPADGAFGLVILQGRYDLELLGERKLLRPEPRDLRPARKLLEKLQCSGWCSQYAGLVAASRLGRMGPEQECDFPEARIDTVFLVNAGDPAGGHWLTPESARAAFRRYNRFRRLVVHALRICNEKEPSETLMKALAEDSGGTYVWLKEPPE